MIDPNAGDYEIQVSMSPSMAMLKLRAFVQDLGGKIVDAPVPQPGVTHVRLRAGGKSAPAWDIPGSSSWSGTGTAAKAPPSGLDIDMELRVQQPDLTQPNNLTIGLTLRAARNAWAISRREVKAQYDKVVRDLKAYLCAITASPGDFIPRP
jgi:hypothetical protein